MQKIKEFLEANKAFKFPMVPNGHAETVGGFFDACMGQAAIYSNPKAIVDWHDLLVRYSEKDGNRLLIRMYEGVTIDHVLETRRGAITQMKNGIEYVFASNYFARIIYTMAHLGYVPSDADFEDMINNRRVCISYPRHVNPGEQEISAYTSRMSMAEYQTSKCYTPGWYLAHIVGVKSTAYKGHENVRLSDFIHKGKSSDWKTGNGMPLRKEDGAFSPSQLKLLRAHFLRFLDPINYFLVPSSSLVIHDSKIKNIGEDPRVVGCAQSKMMAEVEKVRKGVYADFCLRAMVPDEAGVDVGKKFSQAKLDIVFSTKPLKKKAKDVKNSNLNAKVNDIKKIGPQAKKVKDDEGEILAVLRAYLIEGKSYRTIESEILNLGFKVRGGGFKAKKILNGLGVDAGAKGILATPEAEGYIDNCGDPLSSLLKKMRFE